MSVQEDAARVIADGCGGAVMCGVGPSLHPMVFARWAVTALKAARFAIVKLPEAVVGNDWDWCAVLPDGMIDDLLTDSGLLNVDDAREKAAALLAAADAAEAVQ